LDAARYIAFHKAIGQFGDEQAVIKEDILRFILDHGDLEPWKRKVVEIVVQWSDHLYPQFITKLINEGWATYWQWKIVERLKEKFHLPSDVYEECRFRHSRFITAPAVGLKEFLRDPSPYWLGYHIWNEAAKIFGDLTFFAANFNNYDFIEKFFNEPFAGQILATLKQSESSEDIKEDGDNSTDFKPSQLVAFMKFYWGPYSLPRIGVAKGYRDLKLIHFVGGLTNKLLDEKMARSAVKAMKYLWNKGDVILETKNGVGESLVFRSSD
jgi:stage V sporulation protein R